jgi:hypothetical protein
MGSMNHELLLQNEYLAARNRIHPGMPFGFRPESAFSFAGILSLLKHYCRAA